MVGDDLKVLKDGTVEGTFHHVDDFTDFSSEVDEQSGYYFPFKLSGTGTKMTFKKNEVETKKDIPFDPDIIFRVEASDTFEVIVDGKSVVELNFAKATFEEVKSRARKGKDKA